MQSIMSLLAMDWSLTISHENFNNTGAINNLSNSQTSFFKHPSLLTSCTNDVVDAKKMVIHLY